MLSVRFSIRTSPSQPFEISKERRVRICRSHDFLEIPMGRIGRAFSPHYFAAMFPRPVA
jgi:hypothetical protein